MADVQISLSADASEIQAALAKAEASLTALSQKVQAEVGDLSQLEAATSKVIGKFNSAPAALKRAQENFQAVNELLSENKISAEAAVSALAKIDNQARRAAGGFEEAGKHLNAGLTREFIVLGHEIVSGNFSRIPGSMMVLAERSGNLAGIVGALSSPIGLVAIAATAATAAITGMAISSEMADRAMSAMKASFEVTGAQANSAGIKALVDEMAKLPGVSREAAQEIITTFGRTRQMSGEMIEAASLNIERFATLFGKDAPAAAKELAAAMVDPTNAAVKYHKELGVLDGTQIKNIKDFQASNDIMSAQAILFGALTQRANEVPSSLTKIQTAANALGNAWDHLTHSVGETSGVRAATAAWAHLVRTMAEVIKGAEVAGRLVTGGPMKAPEPPAAPLATERGGKGENDDSAAVLAVEEKYQSVKQQQAAIQVDINRMLAQQRNLEGLSDEASVKRVAALREEISAARERSAEMGKTGGGASKMDQWKSELAQQQAADSRSLEDRKTADLAFWNSKLANVTKGSKEEVAIQKEIASTEIGIRKQALADVLANMEAQREAASKGSQDRIDIAKAEVEVLKANPGVSAKAIDDANKRVEQMEREHVELMRQIDEDRINTARDLAKDIIAREQEELTFRRQMGEVGATEEIASLRSLKQQEYEIERQALEDRLKVKGLEVKEQERINNDLMKLDSKRATQVQQLDHQETESRLASIQEWTGPFRQATSTMVSGFMQGTLTMNQLAARGAQSIAISYVNKFANIAEDWFEKHVLMAAWDSMFGAKAVATERLVETQKTEVKTEGVAVQTGAEAAGQIAQTGAVVAGGQAQVAAQTAASGEGLAIKAATCIASVAMDAYTAAAGAYAAIAAIPYVGPILANTAAGTALAAVFAIGKSIASAEGGWDEVPHDGAPAILHKQEMVLSAKYAAPLRAALTSPTFGQGSLGGPAFGLPKGFGPPSFPAAQAAAQQQAQASSKGGNTTVIQIQANDAASFTNMARRNALGLTQAVNSAIANGAAIRTGGTR